MIIADEEESASDQRKWQFRMKNLRSGMFLEKLTEFSGDGVKQTLTQMSFNDWDLPKCKERRRFCEARFKDLKGSELLMLHAQHWLN